MRKGRRKSKKEKERQNNEKESRRKRIKKERENTRKGERGVTQVASERASERERGRERGRAGKGTGEARGGETMLAGVVATEGAKLLSKEREGRFTSSRSKVFIFIPFLWPAMCTIDSAEDSQDTHAEPTKE